MDNEWNVRPFMEHEVDARFFECDKCHETVKWKQPGSLPKLCHPCAQQHNMECNKGRNVRDYPWDLSQMPMQGPLFKRLRKVLHWAPALNRWLYWDGNRWVRGWDIDAYRIVRRVVDEKPEPDTVRTVVAAYQKNCVERAARALAKN